MTLKRSSGILAVKMGIFSEKNLIQKSWSAKKFFHPPKLGARSPPLHTRSFYSIGPSLWNHLPPHFRSLILSASLSSSPSRLKSYLFPGTYKCTENASVWLTAWEAQYKYLYTTQYMNTIQWRHACIEEDKWPTTTVIMMLMRWWRRLHVNNDYEEEDNDDDDD